MCCYFHQRWNKGGGGERKACVKSWRDEGLSSFSISRLDVFYEPITPDDMLVCVKAGTQRGKRGVDSLTDLLLKMENNIEWDISVICYDTTLQQCICSGSIFCRAFEETVSWIEVCHAVDLKRILYSWAALLNCRLHTYSCQSLRSGICNVPEKKWAENKTECFIWPKYIPLCEMAVAR